MSEQRVQLIRSAAARGKYAALFHHLEAMPLPENRWDVSFADLETILGFPLPDSARLHRPWWANQKQGNGHSHALAWQAAGWETSSVNITGETLVFKRTIPLKVAAARGRIDPGVLQAQPGQDTSWPDGAFNDALQDLQEVNNAAAEEGFSPPSNKAMDNAERLLNEMYAVSSRRYEVYPTPDREIAIDAPGGHGRSVILLCDSNGGALCLVNMNGKHRRARYSSTEMLPDGFLREALTELELNAVEP